MQLKQPVNFEEHELQVPLPMKKPLSHEIATFESQVIEFKNLETHEWHVKFSKK